MIAHKHRDQFKRFGRRGEIFALDTMIREMPMYRRLVRIAAGNRAKQHKLFSAAALQLHKSTRRVERNADLDRAAEANSNEINAAISGAHQCRNARRRDRGQRVHAASALAGVHGSICSSTAICSSDKPPINECRQPVLRKMWMASGREGLRTPLNTSLA